MRRKLVILSLSVFTGLLLALALLPWWWGGALRIIGGHFGLSFGEYQRVGYARFALQDAAFSGAGVKVKAARVELGTPLLWLVRRPGAVTMGEWSVVVTPNSGPRSDRPRGWQPLHAQLDALVTRLERWLPPTTAGPGEISWPGGQFTLAGAEWREHRLRVAQLAWQNHAADVTIFSESRRWRVEVRQKHAELLVGIEGPNLSANGQAWGQPFSAQATFGDHGWLPAEAKVQASDWKLPGSRLGMEPFYETVSGGVTLSWSAGSFSFYGQAEGKPRVPGEAPPLEVQLQGSGGLEQVSIHRLEVQISGMTARLNQPVILDREGRLLSGDSRLDLSMDLAKQSWFSGEGQVTGSITVTPQSTGFPVFQATLFTSGVTVAKVETAAAGVDAALRWPWMSVKNASVKLAGGDALTVSGDWNLRTHTFAQVRAQARVSAATVARWLPAGRGDVESLSLAATASGTWPQVAHEVDLQALGVRVPPLRPLALDINWKGTGRVLDSVRVNAAFDGAHLQARCEVNEDSARINECVLIQAGTERLRLTDPVRITWQPSFAVEAFQLKGPGASVAGKLAWGETGEVNLQVDGLESAWLNPLVDLSGPAWSVTALTVQGRWDKGPLTFNAKGEGGVNLERGRKAALTFSAQGNSQGIRLESVRASIEGTLAARAQGQLPVTLHPGQTPAWLIDEEAPLALEAATEPNVFFWEQLASLTGLAVTDPAVRVILSGTLRQPAGAATLHIPHLKSAGKGTAWPEIANLDARLTVDRAGLTLEHLTLEAAGQPVEIQGRLPVNPWPAFFEDPLAVLESAGEARLRIPNADLAALARYAPAYLAPLGSLKADIALKPGGQLEGGIWLKDAGTRPLGPLDMLQSFGAEIYLKGRTVELKQVSALAGGQLVTLSGTVALPVSRAPRFDLALHGGKIPFVRQPGLLVRGDLDLKITTGEDGLTRITGATTLRDSFFLMDVRALIPTSGPRNAPGLRPPYFSVKVPPFDEWPIDVTVDGEKFLRLRTPVFNGVASAHFHLRGTLGDPRATGEATLDQGQVTLPFATFAVRQGGVRITEARPFEPAVSLVGTSRRYGYDLRMEVNGTVDKPQLTFTSTPGLESEQVLLMVMAGETPQNEISYSGRQRAARLGTYLGRSLLGQLGADPTDAERLSISVGERISRQGSETYSAEYSLNPRWSVVGEYDEFDEYNVGVKWRVLSEKKPEGKDARP